MRWNEVEEVWTTCGPVPPRDFVNMVVGYALTCKMRLPALADTIEEARYQARLIQRSQVAAEDIQAAILDHRIPSDQALQHTFNPRLSRTGHASFGLQRLCNTAASPLQSR